MQVKDLIPVQPTLALLAVVVSVHFYLTNLAPDSEGHSSSIRATPPADSNSLVERNNQYSIASQLNRLPFDDKRLQLKIWQLLQDSQFKLAQTSLLEMAATAVEHNDKAQLTNIMLLLGEVASAEQELEMAEVYLMEALDIAIRSGDDKGEARSYQQLGRLHIKSREIARLASNTYDDLWLLRRQIYQGEYRDVQPRLQQVVDANLSIRRYGAAASAYETMAEFYQRFNDDYLAMQAAAQAAKLYASSGRLDQSRKILNSLDSNQIDPAQIAVLTGEINQLSRQYLQDVEQTAQARNYQMLYHHYQNQGETERAWNLRILASKSYAKTSTRLMYQRQPDVMAILYNSNFAMDKARDYLRQASHLFATQGEDEMYADTQWMKSLIY